VRHDVSSGAPNRFKDFWDSLGSRTNSTDSAGMAESPRRFPSPWHADKIPGGYVVRDANGQALAYLYSRDTRPKLGKRRC
jgi:hypothetical protein